MRQKISYRIESSIAWECPYGGYGGRRSHIELKDNIKRVHRDLPRILRRSHIELKVGKWLWDALQNAGKEDLI